MKIERDKWYLTRDGKKIRVVCVDLPGLQSVIGVNEGGYIFTYRPDGGYFCGDTSGESSADLVSEYVEPPKPREVWVRKFEDGSLGSVCWESRAQVSELPNSKLVLLREVIE